MARIMVDGSIENDMPLSEHGGSECCAVRTGLAFCPRFGDRVENGWASEDNPTRVGIFVESVREGYRMTDGNGQFWVASKQNNRLRILPNVKDEPPVRDRAVKGIK